MKYKNLLLVQPSNDTGRENLSRSNIYPPLGLLSIATYLKHYVGERINIKIIDLSIDTFSDISTLLKEFDLIGITTNSFNYKNTLNIAEKAKEKGAAVVLGGVHARALKYNILKNKKFIDFIIDGEGELPLLKLILDEPLQNIPNLVYRNNGSISSNKNIFHDLSVLPIIDRNFIDIDRYIQNYETSNVHNFEYSRPTSIYTHKGCKWRDISGGCIFCSRKDTNLQMRAIEQIWHEIIKLHEKYSVDYIWNIADDFLADIKWIKQFTASKPKNLGVRFLIYTRADHITDETISIMDVLNVHEVLVGFETGDKEMLTKSRKGCSLKSNYNAVELLSKSKIYVYPTFILGMPDENIESMKRTLDFIRYIMERCNVSRLVISTLIPFPGSYAYQRFLSNNKLLEKYLQRDEFDVEDAINDWLINFTNITIDEINSCINDFSNSGYKQNHTCDSKYSFEFLPKYR